jgi:hypothetical protein
VPFQVCSVGCNIKFVLQQLKKQRIYSIESSPYLNSPSQMKTFFYFSIFSLLVFLFLCLASTSMAQNVGVSGNAGYTPYDGAILDLDNSGGLLLPRLTTTERDNLGLTFTVPSDAEGMMIYNRTTERYEMWFNDGGWGWEKVMTESDLGNGFINNTNVTSGLQTPASFEISGSGDVGTTLDVGTTATVGTSLKVGDGIVIGSVVITAPTPGSILMNNDDSWIGTGTNAASVRIEFDKTVGLEGINVLVDKPNIPTLGYTAMTIKNVGTSSGVGLKLSGERNINGSETSFLDFENTDSGGSRTDVLARVGVKNASGTNTEASFQISLQSSNPTSTGILTERLTLDHLGNLVIDGKFTSNGIKETSDGRFKKNINSISNALATVLNLEGVTYNWRTEEFPERSFGERMEYGVIAQQIEKIIPELVDTDEKGYKSVQYSHMVPLLIEAIKEQQLIINSQSQEIGVLKASVEAISEHIKTAKK